MAGEVLSQEQIDLLISQWGSGEIDESAIEKIENDGKQKEYKPFDFRRPNKLKNDNLTAIKQIHENFTKSLSSHLSVVLRSNVQAEVDINSIDQVSYQEYVNTMSGKFLSGHYLWGIFDMIPMNTARWFMQFDLTFLYLYIGRMLGDNTDYNDIYLDDKISDINKDASKVLVSKTLGFYSEVWSAVEPCRTSELHLEEESQNVNIGVLSTDMILIIPIKISSTSKDEKTWSSILNIGIPFSAIEPLLDRLNISSIMSGSISKEENLEIKESAKNINLKLSVSLGEYELTYKDLIELSCGDILVFDKTVDTPFDFRVSGKKKGKCHILEKKDKLCAVISN